MLFNLQRCKTRQCPLCTALSLVHHTPTHPDLMVKMDSFIDAPKPMIHYMCLSLSPSFLPSAFLPFRCPLIRIQPPIGHHHTQSHQHFIHPLTHPSTRDHTTTIIQSLLQPSTSHPLLLHFEVKKFHQVSCQ